MSRRRTIIRLLTKVRLCLEVPASFISINEVADPAIGATGVEAVFDQPSNDLSMDVREPDFVVVLDVEGDEPVKGNAGDIVA